jgi:o-succinylbenzoate synthase
VSGANASVRPYDLPLRRPWRTAQGAVDRRRGFLFRWEDDDGFVGWGDAAPVPGAPEADLARIGAELAARAGSMESTAHPAAENAVNQAISDATAQRMKVPLWRAYRQSAQIPGPAPKDVLVNATIAIAPAAKVAKEAQRLARDGYACLKLKADASSAIVKAVEAVRAAVPTTVALRVDANGAWTRDEAATILARLEPFGVDYVEQPIPPGRLSDWSWLKRRTRVPLAADEDMAGPQAERLIAQKYCDVVVLKPMTLGGPAKAIRLAVLAREAGLDVVVTDSLESAIGRQGDLHLAAAVGTAKRAHGLGSGAWLRTDVVARPPRILRGRLRVPMRVGLGLEAGSP